jgi:hypothetical protein
MENLILNKISKANSFDDFTQVLLNTDKTQSGDKYYRVYLTNSNEEDQIIIQFDKRIMTSNITEIQNNLIVYNLEYCCFKKALFNDALNVSDKSFIKIENNQKIEIIKAIRN